MGLDRNFLLVGPDIDGDEAYGMDPVIINGRQIHGINHKLHPDVTRLSNQKPSGLSISSDLRPRAISAKVDVSIVKQWLEGCQTSHGWCPGELELDECPPDMRLIDCQSRIVIDAKNIDQADLPFAFHPPMQSDARLPAGLPQAIEDAIRVTLATGYRYLWVDQYCIDQDDTVHKAQQIKIMDQIYSTAAWTIVDGAGGDANYGLVGISRPRSEDLGPVRTKHGVEVFHWPSHSAQILNESKWATRAWTYQEAFFSRRIVIFTATGLYFECQKTYENDGLIQRLDISMREGYFADSVIDNRANAGRLFPRYNYGPLTRSLQNWLTTDGDDTIKGGGKLHDFWRRVEEYTSRQMTFPDDSAAAFRGVLQFYVRHDLTHHGRMPLSSVCGIPFPTPPPTSRTAVSQELSLGLCWSHVHGSMSRRRPSFPSWSWAGWLGQARGGSDERLESLLWDISFEAVDNDGPRIRKPWYDIACRDSEVLVLEGNVLPQDALSITENSQLDASGLGSHGRFDLDEDIRYEFILHGLRER
ncbi:hypothetical protein INS49_004840 [Diaporthe citri]|uniref:uncharacterized protein n=1 Tax=Diaporthe citri TaxID=83186 RepID=UPI001C81F74D|nr:uncharacterized protein INS49_004840 [Diaporthe citri]KAG6354236.1 hypothetical protein INS49_004840 [Diaporthe citri]